jgi:hypothetical protein
LFDCERTFYFGLRPGDCETPLQTPNLQIQTSKDHQVNIQTMAPQSSETQTTSNAMEMPKPSALPSNASSSNQPDQTSSDSDSGKDQTSDQAKRFIPDHKKPDAALTFPEKVSEQN